MSVPSRHEWRRRWGELQARRITAAGSVPAAALAGWLVDGWAGWLLGFALPVVMLGRLYTWRCPDCQHRFAGAGLSPMPSACSNCGVAAFDLLPDGDGAPEERRRRHQQPLSIRLRRVIAVSQIIGGVLVGSIALTSALQGVAFTWWYAMMLEGIALTAVLSGVLLWRGHPEGVRLTCILLLLQVVKLYTPWIVYDLRAGFGVLLHASASTVGVMLDARGVLQLGRGADAQPTVAINVLAMVWLCILLRARKHRPAPDRGDTLAPRSRTPPDMASPLTSE